MSFINCLNIANNILSVPVANAAVLGVLYNSDDTSALSYLKSIRRQSEKYNISIYSTEFNNNTPLNSLIDIIEKWNYNNSINGILLISTNKNQIDAESFIVSKKRIEGTDSNNDIKRVSCTARACIKIIKTISTIEGKSILIIGYGKAVGKPLSYLFMRNHACSVTSVHQYSNQDKIFNKWIPESDIIVTAVGKPNFIPNSSSFTNKIFIDAGISVTACGIHGDLNPDLSKHNDITPVPKGVGLITTALLLKNTILASKGEF